jgi:hypothetical protein
MLIALIAIFARLLQQKGLERFPTEPLDSFSYGLLRFLEPPELP